MHPTDKSKKSIQEWDDSNIKKAKQLAGNKKRFGTKIN